MLPSRGLPHDSNGRANRQGRGTEVLREKELRIALVCFGGISLAVYMHGISKEILKLVRASSALHAIADRSRRAKAAFFDGANPRSAAHLRARPPPCSAFYLSAPFERRGRERLRPR